jgi:hypothetical protein
MDQARRNSVPSRNSPSPNHHANTSVPAADPLSTDLYTYNSLNSFSFGSVQPQPSSSSSRPVNPLSPARDDPDNRSEDFVAPTDVTPRPSVVAYHLIQNQNLVRSHPSQPPGQPGWPPAPVSPTSPGRRPRAGVDRDRGRDRSGRDSDTASHHTFGTSSASASATSLSESSAEFSRTGSRASRHTNTTSQTSTNDLSSTDDEEDHHHPIPPHAVNDLSHVPRNSGAESSGTGTAVEFSSDEEYADSEFDYDDYYDDEEGINIEIGSAQYEGSVVTHDWERELYSSSGGGSGSVRAYAGSERRGSLPMAIPGAAPPSGGRDREGSLATIRRPSRSLGDEFRTLGFNGGRGPGHNDDTSGAEGSVNRPLPPAPVSVPESDGDWRSLQERSLMKGKAREQHPLMPGAETNVTRQTRPDPTGEDAMDGFDLDWSNMRGGITTLDHSEVADIVRPLNQGPDSNERRPSARWLPSWVDRRPSTATVTSNYGGDSFGKAVGRWGGDGYQAQRRDWSFRKEKAEQGAVIPAGGDQLGRRPSNTTGFISPRGSMMTERNGANPASFLEREPERGREIEPPKVPESGKPTKASMWKGMALDTQEVWRNDLVGRFKVDRSATTRTWFVFALPNRLSLDLSINLSFLQPLIQPKDRSNGSWSFISVTLLLRSRCRTMGRSSQSTNIPRQLRFRSADTINHDYPLAWRVMEPILTVHDKAHRKAIHIVPRLLGPAMSALLWEEERQPPQRKRARA